jgi:hypothetical protein
MAMARPVSQPMRQATPQSQPQPSPAPQPERVERNSDRGFDFSPGSGPVGPLTVLLLAAASRLKRRRTQA